MYKLNNNLVNLWLSKYDYNFDIYVLNNNKLQSFTLGKKIFISKNILNNLSVFQLLALVFHEVGHIKLKHQLKQILFNVLILLLNISVFYIINYLFLSYFLFIASIGSIIYINRKFEYDADVFSVKHYSKTFSISLLTLFKNKSSFTHPGYLQRIKNIENIL